MTSAPAERLLVLTATLGESPYLAEAVRSVEALSLPVQHVLVCPGEHEPTLRARYPGCAIVSELASSRGLYAALNRALAVTTGWSWFTALNDDDRVAAGFERYAARHCAPEHAECIAYGDVRLIGERGEALGPLALERNPQRFRQLWRSGIVPLMQQGTLISRRVIERLGGFSERYNLCADLDLWVRAVSSGTAFRYHRTHVADFRLRRGQLSADVPAVAYETQDILATLGGETRGGSRLVARTTFRLRNAPRFAERVLRTGHLRTSRLYPPATCGDA